MATLKIKPKAAATATTADPRNERAPVRGAGMGVRRRPTLAEAQAERAQRDAQGGAPVAEPRRSPSPDQSIRPIERPIDARRDVRHDTSREPRHDTRPARRDDPSARPSTRNREFPAHSPPSGVRDQDRRPIIAQPRFPISPPARPAEVPPQRPPQRPAQRPTEAKRRPVARPVRDDDDDERGSLQQPPEAAPGSLRLSKRMSELGLASRREADEWIAKGWVRVDGHIVKELGSRVLPGQRITIDARAKFQQAQKATVLINKPVGYVSGQAEDGYEPAVVLVKPENQWSGDESGTRFLREHLRSLVPAGRLDIDSIGLLVLTQDGRVAKQLIGEDSAIEKEYLVRVAGPRGVGCASSELSADDLKRLRHGLELDGEALKPAIVEWLNDDQLRFVLREGKKRQIRRMCEAVGLKVLGLKRVRIGSVMLGDLPVGQWRYLRGDEVFG